VNLDHPSAFIEKAAFDHGAIALSGGAFKTGHNFNVFGVRAAPDATALALLAVPPDAQKHLEGLVTEAAFQAEKFGVVQ
jgi:hypothetical protein